MAEITLPWPPTLNTHKAVANGRLILSKKGRDYIKQCHIEVNQQKVERVHGELAVVIKLHPPDLRRRDIDNYTKAIFDSLTDCGVWDDDSQVKVLTVYMLEKKQDGCALVYITNTSPSAPIAV